MIIKSFASICDGQAEQPLKIALSRTSTTASSLARTTGGERYQHFSRTSPIAKFEPLRYHWQLEYLADTPKQTFPTAVIFACTYHYQLRRGTTMIFADLFLPALVDFTARKRQHTTTFASSSACLRLPAISYPIYLLLADD